MKKTIGITGASGKLGGCLVEYLLKTTDWEIVTFSSSNLAQWEGLPRVHQYLNINVENIIPKIDMDILVHFAFARRFKSNTDIALSLDFAEKVYKSVFSNTRCKLINISTVGVYAPSEDFINESAAVGPDSLYGMAKYASEVLMRSVFNDKLERTTIIRLGGVAQSQRLIPTFIDNAKNQHKINIVGGSQQFSWIDIDDAISAIYLLLKKTVGWRRVYNVTLNKIRYSITDIARMVAHCVKENGYGDVVIDVAPQDIHICVGWDSSLFIKDTGWSPQTSIEQTINKMLMMK